jgi:hypothetical protein
VVELELEGARDHVKSRRSARRAGKSTGVEHHLVVGELRRKHLRSLRRERYEGVRALDVDLEQDDIGPGDLGVEDVEFPHHLRHFDERRVLDDPVEVVREQLGALGVEGSRVS